ncbi:hypothetical protein, partial [Bacillus altitudinis]|uniref:hypothetical protein n=1 Tax=Bacillus altitudinis TaxID=293387 RepID=UPI001C930570
EGKRSEYSSQGVWINGDERGKQDEKRERERDERSKRERLYGDGGRVFNGKVRDWTGIFKRKKGVEGAGRS